MPTPGLSLVGFLDQNSACNYFKGACVPANKADAALISEWNAARAKLGPAIPGAGIPDIQNMPAAAQPHIAQIINGPWAQTTYSSPLTPANFRLVEVDKLLAFQIAIDCARSSHHCGTLSQPPTLDELLQLCLPLGTVDEPYEIVVQPQSALIKARSLNVRKLAAGVHQTFMGMQFGIAPPFLQVIRFNGRCYLHNGFHRTLGIRSAGATHVPCIFRDVATAADVGLVPGGTFDLTLLESPNPPTLAHFTTGRAYDVRVRAISRVLHISWAEYAVPDE